MEQITETDVLFDILTADHLWSICHTKPNFFFSSPARHKQQKVVSD